MTRDKEHTKDSLDLLMESENPVEAYRAYVQKCKEHGIEPVPYSASLPDIEDSLDEMGL